MNQYHIDDFSEVEQNICNDIKKSLYKNSMDIRAKQFKFKDRKLAYAVSAVLTKMMADTDENTIANICHDFTQNGMKDWLDETLTRMGFDYRKKTAEFLTHMDNMPLIAESENIPFEFQAHALMIQKCLRFHIAHPEAAKNLYDTFNRFQLKHAPECLEILGHLHQYTDKNGEFLGNPPTLIFLAKQKDLWYSLHNTEPEIAVKFSHAVSQRIQLQKNHQESASILAFLMENPKANQAMVFDLMSGTKPSEKESDYPSAYLWTNFSFLKLPTCKQWYERLNPNNKKSYTEQLAAERLLTHFNSLGQKDLQILEKSMEIHSYINGGSCQIDEIVSQMNTNTLKSLLNKLYIHPSIGNETLEARKREKAEYKEYIHTVHALPLKYWEKAISQKNLRQCFTELRECIKNQNFDELDTLLTSDKPVKSQKHKAPPMHPLAQKLKGM